MYLNADYETIIIVGYLMALRNRIIYAIKHNEIMKWSYYRSLPREDLKHSFADWVLYIDTDDTYYEPGTIVCEHFLDKIVNTYDDRLGLRIRLIVEENDDGIPEYDVEVTDRTGHHDPFKYQVFFSNLFDDNWP